MTIGSLFSGIGGLELGLEWAGLGPVLWQVEIDPRRRNCLATLWPEANRFEDVRAVGKDELESVDLICGGFPCQDVSSAGKRAGLRGSRSGLWFEFERIVKELRPRWVVVENVASGAQAWVDDVRLRLEQLGYGSLPVPLKASDCGADHERARVFIVANADSEHLRKQSGRKRRQSRQDSSFAPDAAEKGCGAIARAAERSRRGYSAGGACGFVGREGPPQPLLGRGLHGIPDRAHRIRALGDSVVPQCAEVVGEVIKILSTAKTYNWL